MFKLGLRFAIFTMVFILHGIQTAFAQLDLDNAQLEGAVETAPVAQSAWVLWGGPIALFGLFFLLLLVLKFFFPFKHSPERFNIQTYPVGVKRGLVLALITYAIAFLLGAVDIIYQTTVINSSTEEYFNNFGMGRMFGFTHGHLFGLATSFIIIGVPFSMQFSHSPWKQWTLTIGMAAAITDVISWWAIKLIGPSFELVSAIMGVVFSLSYLYMLTVLLAVLVFPHFVIRIGKYRIF